MSLLRNSTFSNPGKPMRRSAMKRSQNRMKSRGPKMTPIRKSAKGENCTLMIPGVCRNETDTVVWCHSNENSDGKGGGLKARDEEGCYGCFACHSWLDGGYVHFGVDRNYVRVQFNRARELSQKILKSKGLK